MPAAFSKFASSISTETAFDVLAVARKLKASGKDVIELEIGDSPFPTTPQAAKAGIDAILADHCHYGPSTGIPEFRQAAAEYVQREYGLNVTGDNVVAGPGAKTFEQLFCEAFVNPGEGVLVFSPHFPTYTPNIERRGARVVLTPLREETEFRPNLDAVRDFLENDPAPKAIFLNSPHNPTGGVARKEDLEGLAELIRDTDIAVFSDEPYDQMVWTGQHHSLLNEPGMMERTVAAYTFSKSFSMSGWRLGYAVSSAAIIDMIGKLTNTALSCVPPFVQRAGIAGLQQDLEERDRRMAIFQQKVSRLVAGLNQLDGCSCLMPGGSFYVFPSVKQICNRLRITSHGLAMFLLEAADDERGVACLGGECFGDAGAGYLRFSCAEDDDRLDQAIEWMREFIERTDRIAGYVESHSQFRLTADYV